MRVVALSDQHGYLPEIPPCDLLLIGGDVCPDSIGPLAAMAHPEAQKSWFDTRLRRWLARAPAARTVLTWGNHDWCGQRCDFRADGPAAAADATLQVLVDQVTHVQNGDRSASISIWGTPWSNTY